MIADTEMEVLCSRYLDGDLPPEARQRFERLLAEDAGARDRLRELRAVVGDLDALPREPSPPELRVVVRRRLAADSAARRWLDRVQEGLQRLVLDSPLLASFAVVLALGVILYLLAQGVAWRAERPTSVVVPPGGAAAAPTEPPVSTVRILGERRFTRRDGAWWEEGAGSPPGRRLGGTALADWLDRHPEDRALAALGGNVVVRGDDESIVLGFPPAGPAP